MPVVFGKCFKGMSNLNMKQTNVRCYTDLLLSILCVLLFSENNRQFGTYCFVIVKFPLVFFHRA